MTPGRSTARARRTGSGRSGRPSSRPGRPAAEPHRAPPRAPAPSRRRAGDRGRAGSPRRGSPPAGPRAGGRPATGLPAVSTAASTRLNAWSGVHRRGNPTRTRSRARPGTLEAQSPAVTTPTFTLKGLATSLNAGSSSPALISSSNSASARRIAGTQRTGFTARSAASAWAGTPVISISTHSTPTPPSSKVRSVGSSTTTASPSTPAFPAASVPLPVHSSSITDRNDQLAGQRVRHGVAQGGHGQQAHREPALHVARAAADQPPVRPHGRERVGRPDLGFRGHHVDVPVQQQRR